MTDTHPIYSKRAEEAVIGALVGDAPNALPEVIGVIEAGDFWLEECAAIYRAILSLHRRELEIDFMTVAAEMGGEHYEARLVGLSAETPSAVGVATYAYMVRELAERRRAVALANEIASHAHADMHNAEFAEKLGEIRVRLAQIGGLSGKAQPFREDVDGAIERILAALRGVKPRSLPVGLGAIDEKVMIEPGQLVYLAGRPSMGKSSLAYQIVYNWAVRHAIPTLLVVLESTTDRVAMRMITQQTGIPYSQLDRRGELEPQQIDTMWARVHDLQTAPISTIPPGLTRCADIYREAVRLRDSMGLGAIVIDTINKLKDVRDARSQYEGMTNASAALAAIAGELGVTVLALAQLSRGVETRSPFIPTMADLRDSGALEQDADLILMLYRADYYVGKGLLSAYPERCGQGEALCIVAKARDGSADQGALLGWDAERVRFYSLRRPK